MLVPFPSMLSRVQRPPLSGAPTSRCRRLDRLHAGADPRAALIAGTPDASKAQPVARSPQRTLWPSPDEHTDHTILVVSDLIGAVWTVCPDARGKPVDRMRGTEAPPLRAMTDALGKGLCTPSPSFPPPMRSPAHRTTSSLHSTLTAPSRSPGYTGACWRELGQSRDAP